MAAASGAKDAIQLASQLGRLDIVSLILGVLAVVLAIGAVGWFSLIYRHAGIVAETVAREKSDMEVKRYLREEAEPFIYRMVQEYLDRAQKDDFADSVSDSDAQDIAAAMGSGGGEDGQGV